MNKSLFKILVLVISAFVFVCTILRLYHS